MINPTETVSRHPKLFTIVSLGFHSDVFPLISQLFSVSLEYTRTNVIRMSAVAKVLSTLYVLWPDHSLWPDRLRNVCTSVCVEGIESMVDRVTGRVAITSNVRSGIVLVIIPAQYAWRIYFTCRVSNS